MKKLWYLSLLSCLLLGESSWGSDDDDNDDDKDKLTVTVEFFDPDERAKSTEQGGTETNYSRSDDQYKIKIAKDAVVWQLKQRVAEASKDRLEKGKKWYPAENQNLICFAKELQDGQQLGDFPRIEESTIYLRPKNPSHDAVSEVQDGISNPSDEDNGIKRWGGLFICGGFLLVTIYLFVKKYIKNRRVQRRTKSKISSSRFKVKR